MISYRKRRLRQIIEHAYRNVPYYTDVFRSAGITPRDIRTEDDLKHIPLISKRDLQSLPVGEITSRGIRENSLIVRKTSGSTGEPSIIRRTWLEERILQGFRWRSLRSLGWRVSDKLSNIGLPEQIQPSDYQLPARFFHSLGFYRNKKIDCLQSIGKILQELDEQHLDVITGYPGVLSKMAQMIDNNDCMRNKPRFIAAGGETLTRGMKDQISNAFGAPVYNLYGSHEFNLIAWECRETGELHTCDDNVFLEIQREGVPVGEGEKGEVVITGLHSFAMPFIRFRLGDVVTRGSDICSCGQPFSTISEVLGRMHDYFHLPGGGIVHPYEINRAIKGQIPDLIRQHQLIQETRERIIMKIVPIKRIQRNVIELLEESMKEILGRNIDFKIMQVDEIAIGPSGKFRVSHSMIESEYDGMDWEREFFIKDIKAN
ncbi:phenylacetate--CoA ligase family protein [Thermodesulfobacteriota bacterium]